MRSLLIGLLALATAATATALYSTRPPQHGLVEAVAVAVPEFEYRFYERFCRGRYNNPMDRNACMMRSTGTPLQIIERDDR